MDNRKLAYFFKIYANHEFMWVLVFW